MNAKNTEKYALECESNENYWHENYDDAEKDFLSALDEMIAKNDTQRYCDLIENKDNYYVYANRPDYMLARLIYVMCLNETKHRSETSILSAGNSLKELVKNTITIPRFKLWRLELAGDKAAGEDLIDHYLSIPASFYSLCTLITTTSVNKAAVLVMLINICLEKSCISGAFILSEHYHGEFPDDPNATAIYQQLTGLIKGTA